MERAQRQVSVSIGSPSENLIPPYAQVSIVLTAMCKHTQNGPQNGEKFIYTRDTTMTLFKLIIYCHVVLRYKLFSRTWDASDGCMMTGLVTFSAWPAMALACNMSPPCQDPQMAPIQCRSEDKE